MQSVLQVRWHLLNYFLSITRGWRGFVSLLCHLPFLNQSHRLNSSLFHENVCQPLTCLGVCQLKMEYLIAYYFAGLLNGANQLEELVASFPTGLSECGEALSSLRSRRTSTVCDECLWFKKSVFSQLVCFVIQFSAINCSGNLVSCTILSLSFGLFY